MCCCSTLHRTGVCRRHAAHTHAPRNPPSFAFIHATQVAVCFTRAGAFPVHCRGETIRGAVRQGVEGMPRAPTSPHDATRALPPPSLRFPSSTFRFSRDHPFHVSPPLPSPLSRVPHHGTQPHSIRRMGGLEALTAPPFFTCF